MNYKDFLLTLTNKEYEREMTRILIEYTNFLEQATPQDLLDFAFGKSFGELSNQHIKYAETYWGEREFKKMQKAFLKYKNK